MKMEFNSAQLEAINFYEGCCSVMASAGSGKTSVLVQRIVNIIQKHNVEPSQILAITFSKKAALTMQDRLEKILGEQAEQINVRTFHSFGYHIIKTYDFVKYTLLTQDWQKVKIMQDLIKQRTGDITYLGYDAKFFLTLFSRIKNSMEDFKDARFKDLFLRYEAYKEKNKMLDFDDMLSRALWILENNPDALKDCQNHYRYILADEMQDTNAIQYKILELIAKKFKNFFIVGDMMQSIYGFRASDNSYMKDFDVRWPGAKVIHLNTNYRSTDTLVQFSNHFAKFVPESKHKHYVESQSAKIAGVAPSYAAYTDEYDEVQQVAEQIMQYKKAGREYKEMAVLARTNAQLMYFESYFSEMFIPYETVGGTKFSDRIEIKVILSYLRLANDTTNDDSFRYIYCRPNRWLGNKFLDDLSLIAKKRKLSLYDSLDYMSGSKFTRGIADIKKVIKSLQNMKNSPVNEMIRFLRSYLNLDEFVTKQDCEDEADNSRIENMNRLEDMSMGYTLSEFITKMNGIGSSSKGEGVRLMTVHKSKGLEFPIVFVIGVNEKCFPHYRSEDQEEEKRLMYVAITRAEEILHISSSGSPSSFVEMLMDGFQMPDMSMVSDNKRKKSN